MRQVFFLLFAAAWMGSLFADAELDKDKAMDIQTLLQEYVEDFGAVGAAVGWIENSETQYFFFGKKSIQDSEDISKDTTFDIGSITKVFTTLALMDLAAKGEVQLDDPIEAFLPGIKVPEIKAKKITLRHLATHHSGLPRMPDNFNPKNPLNPYEDYTVENLYQFLQSYSLPRAPEEQLEYSNVGMGLLGHILSLKTGQSYEALIQSRICSPLRMQNTAIAFTSDGERELAQGHHLGKEAPHWDFTESFAGAGIIRSNIQDMTRFLAANMGLIASPVADLLKTVPSPPIPAWSGDWLWLGMDPLLFRR